MISVEALSVSLADTPVLDGVSFDVDAGETVGIIGPNGAGKTTLLRTIDGLLEPTRGCVRVLDDRVDSLSARERARRIAVLAQSSEVSFEFTVRDIVGMGRTPYEGRFGNDDGRATAVVDDALERTDLQALSERSITAVSGGERQRVLIARAIAQETPVLLLDEPTVSLDINHQIATFEQARSLAAEGKVVVAAIHDLDLAARYCDRLLLLGDGTQLAVGPPEAVLERQLVERAYGTRVAVRHDDLTGTTSVTPMPEHRARSDVHTHVIGHGGACAPICRELDAAGFEVSLGIVRHGDPDHMVAEALDLQAISLPPAAPIDEGTREAHCRLVRDADVTVVAPFHTGPGNRHLLDVARAARECLLLDDPPFARRNHDGGQSQRRWERLRGNHDVIQRNELLERLATRVPSCAGAPEQVEGEQQSISRRT